MVCEICSKPFNDYDVIIETKESDYVHWGDCFAEYAHEYLLTNTLEFAEYLAKLEALRKEINKPGRLIRTIKKGDDKK